MYLPEGAIYLWNPWMIYFQAVTDGFISLAYLMIFFRIMTLTINFQDIIQYEPKINRTYIMIASCFILTAINYAFDVVSIWIPVYSFHIGMRLLNVFITLWTAFMEMPRLPGFAHAILRRIRGLETDKELLYSSLDSKTLYMNDDLRSLKNIVDKHIFEEKDGLQPLVLKLNTLTEEIRLLLREGNIHGKG